MHTVGSEVTNPTFFASPPETILHSAAGLFFFFFLLLWFSWCRHFGVSTSLADCFLLVFLASSSCYFLTASSSCYFLTSSSCYFLTAYSSCYFRVCSRSSCFASLSALATHLDLLASTTSSWWVIPGCLCVFWILSWGRGLNFYLFTGHLIPSAQFHKVRIITVLTSQVYHEEYMN